MPGIKRIPEKVPKSIKNCSYYQIATMRCTLLHKMADFLAVVAFVECLLLRSRTFSCFLNKKKREVTPNQYRPIMPKPYGDESHTF